MALNSSTSASVRFTPARWRGRLGSYGKSSACAGSATRRNNRRFRDISVRGRNHAFGDPVVNKTNGAEPNPHGLFGYVKARREVRHGLNAVGPGFLDQAAWH